MIDKIYRLDNPVQNYAWGSTSTIAELLGVPPTGEPMAELWLGAHPAAPSRIVGEPAGTTLLELIEQSPESLLGPAVEERFGELPFLLKILAVEHPLSLQAHPTRGQARAGFEAENTAGVAIDSPRRNYRDANHKPEQVCALTEFDGLCGFRPVDRTAEFLTALSTPGSDELRGRLMADGGLAAVVTELLNAADAAIAEILDDLIPAAVRVASGGGSWAAEAGWIVRLDQEYPGDRGAVIGLLLNLVHLRPGQALFLHAGELHAYLQGTAVELMGNSDNVLRGGLTPKYIDVPELLSVLEIHEDLVTPSEPSPSATGELVYPSDVADFRLARVDVDGSALVVELSTEGPRILLCTEGTVTVTSDSGQAETLHAGQSAFVPASVSASIGQCDGNSGVVYIAAPNLSVS
ncbi:MAG: manA [Pseudonocardiales bacterium]|nr:manA [Pseudonocardiales bacterium]